MILNFLDKFKLSIPDEFANEKSIKSPFSLAERIENGMWEKEEIVLSKKYIKKI